MLATFTGRRTLRLELVREAVTGWFRLRLVAGGSSSIIPASGSQPIARSGSRSKGADRTYFRARSRTSPEELPSLKVARESNAADWVFQPNVLRPSTPEELSRASIDAQLTREETPPLEQCEELLP